MMRRLWRFIGETNPFPFVNYLVLFLAVIWILFVIVHSAYSHDWYDPECCSNRDCAPVSASLLRHNADGSVTYGGCTFRRTQMRHSRDDQWHACVTSGGACMCLYVPEPVVG